MRNLREAWEVPRDLLLRRYPPFVTGGPLPAGDVPVFVFHSLEPAHFGAQLAHLARNGYRTLGADEYLAMLEGRLPAPERTVVPTFDDGAAPSDCRAAAERHGMRGIVFPVPGRRCPVHHASHLGRREAGCATAQTVLAREDGPGALSWEDRELARSGVFDFESHTQPPPARPRGPRVRLPDARCARATPRSRCRCWRAGGAGCDLLPVRGGAGHAAAGVGALHVGGAALYEDRRASAASPPWRRPAGPPFGRRDQPAAAAVAAAAGRGAPGVGRRSRVALRPSSLTQGRASRRTRRLARLLLPARLGTVSRRLAAETGTWPPQWKGGGNAHHLRRRRLCCRCRIGDDYLRPCPDAAGGLATVLARKWRRRFGGGA
jgi:hypothetical protein